ncbi:MAG: DUF2621 family protein [Candidatus Omnitrophica bacterium]|nr:DUF2621 family protein [Candidatus Omnitrophota bacterium]
MSNIKTQLEWESNARQKYDEMIRKLPLFHRDIAKQVVDKKAVINAQERKASMVEEEDVVRAFLTEVPLAFYSLMIRLFDEVGFDYKQYENE